MRKIMVRRLPQKTAVIYQYGKRVSSYHPDGYKGRFYSFKESLKRIGKLFVILLVLSLSMAGLGYHFTKSEAKVIIEKPIIETEIPPILQKIAKCESNNNQNAKHIDPADVGKYGIRVTVWGRKAHELGWDLYTEYGNEQMALWIYHNRGTEDWYSSRKCWNK